VKKKLLRMLAPVLMGAALLGACSDGTGPARVAKGQDPLVARLVEMGFRRDQIRDAGSYFVVEGDILFDKKALAAAPRAVARAGGPAGQRAVGTVSGSRRTIRVNLGAVQAENASWATATRAAMTNWSSINGADITLVEAGPADITVSFANNIDFDQPCVVAQGSFPISGAPGTIIRINRSYAGSYGAAQQTWIMTHEFGHNLGLAHTNSTAGTQISGTPTSDAASVMNSGGGSCPPAAPNWSAFSAGDQTAARTLYPLPWPTPTASASGTGTALVSWNALSGALYYQIRRYEVYREHNGYESWSNESSYVGPWIDVYGTSYDAGAAWTGTSECYWEDGGYTEHDNFFGYEVRAVFSNGTSAYAPWVGAGDATC
jgi:hypothetical protein